MKDETKAIHIGARRANGGVAPAIQLSTTFEHGPAGEHLHGFEYIRDGNPNVDDLETRLAALEIADGAVAFGSGMGAGTAVLSKLRPGARALFHKDLYFDFRALAEKVLPNWGLRCVSVDLTDERARQEAYQDGVDLIWFESPSNPAYVLRFKLVTKVGTTHFIVGTETSNQSVNSARDQSVRRR